MPCDAACQAKIRLNGARILFGLQTTLEEIDIHVSKKGVLNRGDEMIGILNQMEDLSDKFAQVAIKDIGYDGALNHSLETAR